MNCLSEGMQYVPRGRTAFFIELRYASLVHRGRVFEVFEKLVAVDVDVPIAILVDARLAVVLQHVVQCPSDQVDGTLDSVNLCVLLIAITERLFPCAQKKFSAKSAKRDARMLDAKF